MEQKNKLSESLARAVSMYGMLDVKGVLVGFSGGADSTALLRLLVPLCRERGIYLAALHVHHGIRGDEADRDADFCRRECESLGVDFDTQYFDVPDIAEKSGKGIEETARICRYQAFVDKVRSDSRLDCIATAHNADDNAETVIFNLARGCGSDGLCGIPPVRCEKGIPVIRPLIYCTKADIVAYLEGIGAEYIFDSTNDDTAYRRNFIRHEIMPRLCELNPSFFEATARMTRASIRNRDYLDSETKRFLSDNYKNGIPVSVVADSHPAIASRAIARMIADVTDAVPESVHIENVISLAKTGRNGSSLSLCQNVRAVIDAGVLRFTNEEKRTAPRFMYPVGEGVTRFDTHGFAVISAQTAEDFANLQKNNETLQNIYKLSISTRLNFDKINGTLFVRSRRDGDAYVFGGMTRKLKKLYNDRKLPISLRETLPIFCDGEGIVWVPGFLCADRVKGSDECGGLVYYYNNGE